MSPFQDDLTYCSYKKPHSDWFHKEEANVYKDNLASMSLAQVTSVRHDSIHVLKCLKTR